MRTTVDFDEDVLQAAKHLAQERGQSLGRVLSDLVRRGLQPPAKAKVRRGAIPILPPRAGGRPVTSQVVKELLEKNV